MRVLVVDDNAMNLDLFTDVLEADGHDVIVERDGIAARDRAMRESFDLIVLDIQLPGLDGHSICRQLREAGIDRPIVALSSSAMPDQIERGLQSGFDAYLTKPISPLELRAAVHRFARAA